MVFELAVPYGGF
uniref:Uncharacterized protein n=1 Tax=Rhizophora mucronata TaxID=61149 RepID=A0A2P2PZD4_RHIMU